MRLMSHSTLFLGLAVLSLSACGDKGTDDTGTAEADADTDTDTDTDTDSDTDADPTFLGNVAFSDGSDPTDITVQMCNDSACIPAYPDAAGDFTYSLGADDYAFEVLYRGSQDDWTTALAPITLTDGELKSLDSTVVIYPFSTFEDLEAAGAVVGDGITFTDADPAGMEPALTSPSQDKYVATTEIDPSAGGLPVEGISGTVVAMWYTGNFDSHLTPAWSFETTSDYGLDDGTVLKIYTADYADASWHDDGTATVTDGKVVSDEGSGASYLATIILVQE